jgi:hypothetical protein
VRPLLQICLPAPSHSLSFLGQCLTLDPAARPSVEAVIKALDVLNINTASVEPIIEVARGGSSSSSANFELFGGSGSGSSSSGSASVASPQPHHQPQQHQQQQQQHASPAPSGGSSNLGGGGKMMGGMFAKASMLVNSARDKSADMIRKAAAPKDTLRVGADIDLSFITPRLVAMAYPFEVRGCGCGCLLKKSASCL